MDGMPPVLLPFVPKTGKIFFGEIIDSEMILSKTAVIADVV